MLHLFPFLAIMMLSLGCDFEFPTQGTVADGTSEYSFHTDTVLLNDSTSSTTQPDITRNDATSSLEIQDIAGSSADGISTPDTLGSDLRACTSHSQCRNGTPGDPYQCLNGICIAPSLSCTNDEECSDHHACNGNEQCLSKEKVCALGIKLECDDDEEWTGQECTPHLGCVYWPLIECVKNDDCGDPDMRCDQELGGWCVEVDSCILDSDCDDNNACTYDRCLVQRCDNEPIICFDFIPDTMDECHEDIGCTSTYGCYEDAHCDDWDAATRDTCENQECVHTRVYALLSVFSADHNGDKVSFYSSNGSLLRSGLLPYERVRLLLQAVCDGGLEIDMSTPHGECRTMHDGILDIWMGDEMLDYVVIYDDCGDRLFIPPSVFSCAMPP